MVKKKFRTIVFVRFCVLVVFVRCWVSVARRVARMENYRHSIGFLVSDARRIAHRVSRRVTRHVEKDRRSMVLQNNKKTTGNNTKTMQKIENNRKTIVTQETTIQSQKEMQENIRKQ